MEGGRFSFAWGSLSAGKDSSSSFQHRLLMWEMLSPLTSPSATLCRFDIRGNGQCAYLNLAGVSSDWCSQQKYSVCSHPLKSPRGAWRGGEP